MKIILRNATILDSSSPHFNKTKDILIENGRIIKIEDYLSDKDSDSKEITSPNLCISQSWVDLNANFCDPGNESNEDLSSGRAIAEAAGFGHVFLASNTHPVVDHKALAFYLQSSNANGVTQLHSIGAITKGLEGKELAEMNDLYSAGVRLFSDSLQPLSTAILYRALMYIKNVGGKIISFPQTPSFSLHGQINEGYASVKTGLKAIPSIGEELGVLRDIHLAEYTDNAIHLSGISSEKSVHAIREAKKKGIQVTCDVFVHHLLFNETATLDFDTNHKVQPPYRRETDRKALWAGIEDGTIDCIVSNHQPKAVEQKVVPFDQAAFGSISLQTFYAALMAAEEVKPEKIIDKITVDPRKIANFHHNTSIQEGNEIDCTLFDPTIEWSFNADTNLSKSTNSPFLNKKMKGKAIGLIRGTSIIINTTTD